MMLGLAVLGLAVIVFSITLGVWFFVKSITFKDKVDRYVHEQTYDEYGHPITRVIDRKDSDSDMI